MPKCAAGKPLCYFSYFHYLAPQAMMENGYSSPRHVSKSPFVHFYYMLEFNSKGL